MLKIVLSAPSGAGKTTLWKELVKIDRKIMVSVSCTTRKKRRGEREGYDYYFLSKEEFFEKIKRGELIEWAEVHGNYYGTPFRNLSLAEEKGKDILFEVDIQGAKSLREKIPDAILIFVMPPSLKELKRRLEQRGDNSEEEVKRRLIHAEEEIKAAEKFDYIIVNDDLEKALKNLQAIITSERLRAKRNLSLIEKILERR